jgi:ribosomal protein L20A (L18A)
MDKAAYKDAVLRDLKEVVKVDVQRGKDRPMSSYINLGIEFLKRRFQSSNKWNRNKAWTPKALQYVTNLWMEIEPEIIQGTEKMLQDAKHRKLTKEMRATTARAAIRTAMQEAGIKHRIIEQTYRAKVSVLVCEDRALTFYILYSRLYESLPKVMESVKLIMKEMSVLGKGVSIEKAYDTSKWD